MTFGARALGVSGFTSNTRSSALRGGRVPAEIPLAPACSETLIMALEEGLDGSRPPGPPFPIPKPFSLPEPWPPVSASLGAPRAPPAPPCAVPVGVMENAPSRTPKGIASFSGPGSTLSAMILGVPAGFWVSIPEGVPWLLLAGCDGGALASLSSFLWGGPTGAVGVGLASGGVEFWIGGGGGTSR